MFDLTEKTALVTGSGSGIGQAIAHALAGSGAYVYIADIDQDAGEKVAEAIKDTGGSAEFIKVDVSNLQDCTDAADKVHADRGDLDVLVNNAGIGHVGTILSTDSDDLERLMAVNVRGAFDLTKAFIGRMIERKYGVIINIASIGGLTAIRDRLAYCTTKFALVGMTKCIALDHARDGIRANAICPGRVETPFVRSRLAEYADPKAAYEEMAATQAIGRMGTPAEIAGAALYLASDEAAFVTGTALEIDGGFRLGK